jgi:NitT/TauT family transport system substrate-binding protein
MKRARVGLLTISALVLAACGSNGAASSADGSDASPAADPTAVTFMVANPVINLGHTQLAVAQQLGYYDEGNVDVEYLTSDGTVAAVQAVATGSANMAQSDTLAIDAAVAQEVDNVTAVCSYVAQNIYYIVVPEDSDIQSVADLAGKRIGLSSLATGVYYNARVALENEDIDPETGVEFVTIAEPAAQLNALQTGEVDALSIIDVSVGTFENQGVDLRTFQASGPMEWQWNVVIVNDDFLAEHRDAVTAVCRGIQKAEHFVATSPEAAVAVFTDWGGDAGGVEPELAANVVRNRAEPGFKTYEEGDGQWGWINVDQMDELAALYLELGLIEQEIDVSGAYTNDLVPDLQFDEAEVAEQATNYGK